MNSNFRKKYIFWWMFNSVWYGSGWVLLSESDPDPHKTYLLYVRNVLFIFIWRITISIPKIHLKFRRKKGIKIDHFHLRICHIHIWDIHLSDTWADFKKGHSLKTNISDTLRRINTNKIIYIFEKYFLWCGKSCISS